jgi:hypothetical protein
MRPTPIRFALRIGGSCALVCKTGSGTRQTRRSPTHSRHNDREHRKTLGETPLTIVHLNRTCTSESPILRRHTEPIDSQPTRLVHGQHRTLQEISHRFAGRKIKGSQASPAPTGMCFNRCRKGEWGGAERLGMHSHAERGTISGRALNRDLAVIVRELVCILFQQCQILALSSESLTLPRPFIFLLRLCA